MKTIIGITTAHNGRAGNRGILTEIAKRLGVSRAAVSQANKNPRKYRHIASVLLDYQRYGRLPNPRNEQQ